MPFKLRSPNSGQFSLHINPALCTASHHHTLRHLKSNNIAHVTPNFFVSMINKSTEIIKWNKDDLTFNKENTNERDQIRT
jgi:hypothetical protein